jgi:uncharacterized protein YjbJ (UPF0337 family)
LKDYCAIIAHLVNAINLQKEELFMGLPNKDELEGKWDQTKGAVKENVGRAFDDPDLEAEGKGDRVRGNVKEGVGKVRRKVGETIEDIGEDIKR